jgi:hypothetical protein
MSVATITVRRNNARDGGDAEARQIQETCLNVFDVDSLAPYRANHLVPLAQPRNPA